MATPIARAFRLNRSDGAPLEGTVLAAGGQRPAVVVCPGTASPLAPRLARAGLAVITWEPGVSLAEGLTMVLEALRRGELGIVAPAVGVVGAPEVAVTARGARWFAGDLGDVAAVMRWCAETLS
jgi:hypothetical protein